VSGSVTAIDLQQVVGSDVECGREGVDVGRHDPYIDTLASRLQAPKPASNPRPENLTHMFRIQNPTL
jgi:hypothetical protein